MDNKRLIIILSVWTVIFTLMGGTFAYWNWQSTDNRKTNVTFTVNRDYTCAADSGGHITSNDVRLAPAKCNDPVYAIKRPITTSVTTTGDKVVSLDLWLNINNISTNLTNTPNFRWVIGKNGNNCESGIIKQGDFRNIQDNKIDLLDGVEYATLDDKYYLYIWLDEAETNNNTMNQSFDFSISGKCVDNGLEKALLKSLDTTDYFREDDYKTKITDIAFIYDKDLPSGVTTNNVKTYDLGANASKPITGYLVNGDSEDTYKLYVSSEYKIYAQVLASAFNGMTALKNIMFDNFDTSETTNMSSIFRTCSSLLELDVTNFNTSNVTNMTSMFMECDSLTRIDLSAFDTSKVTSMQWMFGTYGSNNSLTALDLSNFNTSNVTHMGRMFSGCRSLISLDLSSFDTSNVTRMNDMFNGCSNLTELDLSNFDTSNVIDMTRSFSGCRSLTELDLSNFNTFNVTAMSDMFNGCSTLTSLDISSFDTSNVTNMIRMFQYDYELSNIFVSDGWNTAAVTIDSAMFSGCSKLPNFNSSVTDKTNAHYGEGGYLTYKVYNG